MLSDVHRSRAWIVVRCAHLRIFSSPCLEGKEAGREGGGREEGGREERNKKGKKREGSEEEEEDVWGKEFLIT